MRDGLIEVTDVLTLDRETQRVFVTDDFYLTCLNHEEGAEIFLQEIWDMVVGALANRYEGDYTSFDPGIYGWPNLLVSQEIEYDFNYTPTGRMQYTISNDLPVA